MCPPNVLMSESVHVSPCVRMSESVHVSPSSPCVRILSLLLNCLGTFLEPEASTRGPKGRKAASFCNYYIHFVITRAFCEIEFLRLLTY